MATSPSLQRISTPNWRAILKKNESRSRMVIAIFFLIYLSVGFLLDLLIYSEIYPTAHLDVIAKALLTFQIIPYASITLLIIAVISLWVTITFNNKLMLLGCQHHEITPMKCDNPKEKQLYNTVEEMKIAAGLRYMPKVYVIEGNYMNAFASGYSEKSALIAVTSRLLDKLDRNELQAVVAHELSHIRHLDIKLTLTAALLANLTLMVLDIICRPILYGRSSSNRKGKNGLLILIVILRVTLPIINMLLLLYLSRKREYMADAGCVALMRDNKPLASALLKIQNDHVENRDEMYQYYKETQHEGLRREAYLYDPSDSGIKPFMAVEDMLSTHPNIKDRLKAIGFKNK